VLLLLVVELAGASAVLVHALGLALLAGRVMHAVGYGATPQIIPLRIIGMLLTFTMLGVSAGIAIFLAVF
jgi:uncharacterized membrane protein YecN with MAPEG domain